MPQIMMIEGIEDLDGSGGHKYRRRKGGRQVASVREDPPGSGVCVVSRYGPFDEDRPRMATLCLEHDPPLNKMKVGGNPIDIEPEEAGMAGYGPQDFPPIDDFADFDQLVSPDFIRGSLVGAGSHVGARIVGDLTRLIPGPEMVKPAAKAGLGLVGGRVLWGVNRDAGLVFMSTLLGGALYDDLLRPMVLTRFLPGVFGDAVEIDERDILGQLTEDEEALLSQLTAEEEALLAGTLEEEDEPLRLNEYDGYGGVVDEDEGSGEDIEVGDYAPALGTWIG